MRAKLKDSAPWPDLKLKKGLILNKIDFTEVTHQSNIDQIKSGLSKVVEIEGQVPKKRVLKTEGELTEAKLRSMLKFDIQRLLIERGFDEQDLTNMKKAELINAYLIDQI